MKRIFAMVLCLTMLLSQMAMVADALRAKELLDLIYLEENGIVVEGGGSIQMQTPLGRSDTTERYSPYVPKLIPEALKNLGLLPKDDKDAGVAKSEESEGDIETSGPPAIKTVKGTFNKNTVELFTGAGETFESVVLYDALGMELEILTSSSVVWHRLYHEIDGIDGTYMFVRAGDLTLEEPLAYDGAFATTEDNFTVQVYKAPQGATVEIEELPPEKAPPLRQVRGKNMGNRELIYSCDITIRNSDGSEWQPEDGPVEVGITLPELPELSERGKYYVEHVDHEGNVELLRADGCLDTNMIIFNTDGFSSFFIYTVDFTVNGVWHSILGGTSIYLSDLLTVLEVDYKIEEVESVSFTDSTLVEVVSCEREELGADWKLTSLQPFFTEELLTITLKNGEKRVIYVYDAPERKWISGGEYTVIKYHGDSINTGNYYTVAYDQLLDTSLWIRQKGTETDAQVTLDGTIQVCGGVQFWIVPNWAT